MVKVRSLKKLRFIARNNEKTWVQVRTVTSWARIGKADEWKSESTASTERKKIIVARSFKRAYDQRKKQRGVRRLESR